MNQIGVYKITNTMNGCFYIGSTCRGFHFRWQRHIADLRANRHSNTKLQADWNTYGEDAFEFSVVEAMDDGPAIFAKEQELVSEKHPKCYNSDRKIAANYSGLRNRNRVQFVCMIDPETLKRILELKKDHGSRGKVIDYLVQKEAKHARAPHSTT